MKQTLVRLESRVARDILDDADEHTGLRIERTFNAPRDLVWEAWTDPKHVAKWHGPEGFTAPHVEADFRVGGKFLSCMEAPDGTQFWSTGMYHEIDPKDLIVASDYFADKDGNIVHASKYGMPEDFPLEMFVVTEFEDLNGTTKLTLTHYGMPAGEMTEGATQGWNQSLDKLAAIVEG
ncbi:MAG: ATPase [Ectothiorhodospiraceae bacterium]|nr:ATPase [Ectothiorhodospiraceae bacterium]